MISIKEKSMNRLTALILLSFAFILALVSSVSAQTPAGKVDSDTISGLGARNIGSAAMSGRITSIAGVHEGQRLTIYVGAASGGVWESMRGRTPVHPVVDKQTARSVRAIILG